MSVAKKTEMCICVYVCVVKTHIGRGLCTHIHTNVSVSFFATDKGRPCYGGFAQAYAHFSLFLQNWGGCFIMEAL